MKRRLSTLMITLLMSVATTMAAGISPGGSRTRQSAQGGRVVHQAGCH